jgi:hypothetical protein
MVGEALHELEPDARQVERLGGVGEVDEGIHREAAKLGLSSKRTGLVVEGKSKTGAFSLWTHVVDRDGTLSDPARKLEC